METGHDEDESASPFDDLVLVVEVEPGPTFRIAEVGGRPVANGAISSEDAAGTRLGPSVETTERTMRHLRLAWETQQPHRYVADRPEGRLDVYVVPLAGAAGEDRLLVHLYEHTDPGARRRDLVNAAIVDALPGSVALVDGAGVIRAVNAAWVRFGLERSHDGVLADAGTSYLEVTERAACDDPSAEAAAQAIRSVLAAEVDFAAADYPSEGSSESERFTMRVAPVEIDGERWALVAHEDVTGLRHALDRWHSTFSNAAVPTIILDGRGDIVDANAAFAELLGVDLPSAIGRSIIHFVHPDHRAQVRKQLRRAAAGKPPMARELELVHADGSAVTVMMHPSPTLVGQRPGAVMQLVDLTQQRRAESRLALHRELLELVAAGTPLAEVALAVAINIRRAIDGAVGAVLLPGAPPVTAPGTPDGWQPHEHARRVPIDDGRPDLGAILIESPRAKPAPGEDEAAAMLASIVRLAVQRDEIGTLLALPRLPTREVFGRQLDETIDLIAETPTTLAVFAVGPTDLDALLTEHGRSGTEAVLAEIGAAVHASIPDADVVTRRAHTILALVETGTESDAVATAARLTAAGNIAVGVATAADEGATADVVIAEAEAALAVARRRADRIALFGPSMRGSSVDDRAAADLRRGLDAGEVSVHYQPIVDLHSGATVSLEALVRWEHPTRGFVPPPELIRVAEGCGLIKEIGSLVLATACRDLATWRAAGARELSVAVNLSASQLADPGLVALVQLTLDRSGLEPTALTVEITESVVVDDVDLVAAALAELRALGVRVAIDDFGTGYSSLVYLKRFPADVLKVDRAFVQGLGVHDGDTAIVEAVVGLGHRLGLEVVAEGVETDAQLNELRRRSCDQAQGYLLQRPVPAEGVDRFLGTGAVDLGPEPVPAPATQLDMDQLLSLVTHELSTPLSVIGGHAELLADLMRRDDESPIDVIDALERNIRNLDDLLRSLSGLSSALGSPSAATDVELVKFVELATRDLGPLLAEHDVRVRRTSRPIAVNIDPVALRQILTNLLSNAVKFTDPGTLIEVAVRSAEHHEIAVVDHGGGVPPERETELFGRYARLGARARGLGLGLHLSRALVRRQGGDLVHERTPGGGATFVVRIPR